jgi:hypothetical protein
MLGEGGMSWTSVREIVEDLLAAKKRDGLGVRYIVPLFNLVGNHRPFLTVHLGA